MAANIHAKVLLIEDEPDVRESYIDMLHLLGYEVEPAENGMSGLEKLQKDSYDIVITDLNMPVMDGLETLRRIKKKEIDTEVIVVTGFATIENAIGAMKQGAFDYITKPVSIEHVRIVLSKCMQKINGRRENAKLKNINAELSELNELKDKFITITNHELRTPLAVLKGYIDLLNMETDGNGNADVEEYVGIITDTVEEMVDMIDSMHNLSNFTKIKNNFKFVPFEINELLESLYKETKVLFTDRDIEYNFISHKNPLMVNCDYREIKRAVRELIQNALKFTDKGGKVTLALKNVSVKDQIYITVTDTGIGIPIDKQDLIFEPFYEVQDVMHHSTSKTEFMGGGIGVGLSLAKEIVESHNGEIAVESTPDEGSTFTIVLPQYKK
jgi:signal transduction histidine kinase